MEEGEWEWQIALKLLGKKKCFYLKKKAESNKNQIGTQEIQKYASFSAQNADLLVSEYKYKHISSAKPHKIKLITYNLSSIFLTLSLVQQFDNSIHTVKIIVGCGKKRKITNNLAGTKLKEAMASLNNSNSLIQTNK